MSDCHSPNEVDQVDQISDYENQFYYGQIFKNILNIKSH